MGLLIRAFERRSNLANPDPWLVSLFGGQKTAAGISVSPDTALRFTAVYGAVRILAVVTVLVVHQVVERSFRRGAQGYNLIGNIVNCSFTPTTGDQVGASATLYPLANNGGCASSPSP